MKNGYLEKSGAAEFVSISDAMKLTGLPRHMLYWRIGPDGYLKMRIHRVAMWSVDRLKRMRPEIERLKTDLQKDSQTNL